MATGCTDSVRIRSGNSDRLAVFAAEPERVRKNAEESGYYFVRNVLTCPFLGLPGRRWVSVRGEDPERCCSLNKPVYENMISSSMFERVLYLIFLAIHGQRKHAALRVSRKLGKTKKKNKTKQTSLAPPDDTNFSKSFGAGMESSQRLGTAIRAVLRAWQTVADHAGVKDMETLTAPFVVFDSNSFWYASLEENYAEEAQGSCLSDGVGIFTAVKTR